MPELLAVGLEATAVVLAMSAACVVAGYGLTRRLAPRNCEPPDSCWFRWWARRP